MQWASNSNLARWMASVATLAAFLTVGLLRAQSRTSAKLVQPPSPLRAFTPQEINSLLGPAGGHTTSVKSPDGSTQREIPILLSSGRPPNGVLHIPCTGPVYESPVDGSEQAVWTKERLFFDAARRYDLIALGRVLSSKSYMLPDGGFLYSLLQFRVQQVIRNNPAAPVEPGKEITIGREGGILRTEGVVVSAVCTDFPLYQIGDLQYLLFFKYIPKAKIYLASRWGYTFLQGKAVGVGPRFADTLFRNASSVKVSTIVGMSKASLLQMAEEQAERATKLATTQ